MSRWTPEQAAAINHRGSDLLVSAAAGSGKTAVLVERIISLLLDENARLDIDRLLVVTFTRAAAAEMRQRIQLALLTAQAEGSADAEHIQRQLDLLPEASISTIHAFCTRVLRRHYYMAGLSPDFRIADATETELLKAELMAAVLEREYERDADEVNALVELFGGRIDDSRLQQRLLQLYGFMQSKVDGHLWLRDSISALNHDGPARENPWARQIPALLGLRLPAVRARMEAALRLAREGGIDPYESTLEDDLQMLAGLEHDLAALPVEEFMEGFRAAQFGRLNAAPRDCDAEARDKAKALREEAKKQLAALQQSFAFKPLADMLEDMAAMVPALERLQRIEEAFAERFAAEKRARNLVDYNDLEQLSLAVLRRPEVAQEYRDGFEHVMVDEYQDSNEVQEAILQAVSRDDNRFMVGDVKQSIYRFRLAAPEIFLRRGEEYARADAAGVRIDLSANFRSGPAVIAGVNHVFARLMSAQQAEIEYDERAALTAGLPPHELDAAAVRVSIINRQDSAAGGEADEEAPPDSSGQELSELKDIELEALLIKRQIEELVGQPFYDHRQGGVRPLQYRDMVILLRNTRQRAALLADILQAGGIPVYADSNTSYFETAEVRVMLNLLALLDNGEQDLPLLSILNSPLFDFSLSELYAVRRCQPRGSYRAALEACAAGETPPSAKAQAFLDRLEQWQFLAAFLPVDDLIWTILHQTGYYHYVLALPGGEQRQANLRLLLDQARQFGQSSLSGLFAFLQFMERVRSSTGDQSSARLLGENSDLVRIMSIHKSKGLEFPVVFVGGLGQRFNFSDLRSDMLLHRQLGLGLRCVDVEQRVWSESLSRSVLREQLQREQLAEELRILYVAFTRARYQLLLSGAVKNLETRRQRWSMAAAGGSFFSAQDFLDWLGPIITAEGEAEALFDRQVFTPAQLPAATGLIPEPAAATLRAQLLQPAEAEADIRREVERRLSWEYPHARAGRILSKQSVSRLSHRGEDAITPELTLKPRPGFLEAGGLSAAERGTLYHLALQHLPPELHEPGPAEAWLDELARREIITPAERQALDTAPLLAFNASELGQRLRAAQRIHRELPFNYIVTADSPLLEQYEVYPDMLIQGVIDLCFLEDGQWVIVDYKSDRADDAAIRRRYARQLELYRLALEQISGLPVKEALFWNVTAAHAIRV